MEVGELRPGERINKVEEQVNGSNGASRLVEEKWPLLDEENSGSTFSVEQAIDQLGFGRFQYLLLGYAGLAWMAEAMELMLLSYLGPAVQSQWGLSSQQESVLTSVVFVGMLIGAYSWGVLSDVKGRRAGFSTTAVLTFLASFLSALAPSYLSLLFFRFLVGVGLGGAPVVFSLFLEFVPAKRRGFWLVIFSLFWTLGSMAEAGLAWAVMPTLGWRWLLGLSSMPLALLLLLFPILPESPRFYMVKDRPREALDVLNRVAKMNSRALPRGWLVAKPRPRSAPVVQATATATATAIATATATTTDSLLGPGARALPGHQSHEGTNGLSGKGHSVCDDGGEYGPVGRAPSHKEHRAAKQDGPFAVLATLVAPPLLRSTVLLWTVFFANAFTYYGLVLLTAELTGGALCVDPTAGAVSEALAAGAAAQSHYRDVFITSFAEAPGVALAALVVDRFGRKTTMGVLLAFTGLSLVPLLQPIGAAYATAALFAARACIMGAFQVLFLYAPEVYPTSTRSTGLGIANSFSRLGGILCPFVAVGLVKSCQQSLAVSLFVIIPIGAAIAVAFFPQETSGKGLSDEVDDGIIDVEFMH